MSSSSVTAVRPQATARLHARCAANPASSDGSVPEQCSLAELDQWRRQLNQCCDGITEQLNGIRGDLTDISANDAAERLSVPHHECRLAQLVRRRRSRILANREALSVFTVAVGDC